MRLEHKQKQGRWGRGTAPELTPKLMAPKVKTEDVAFSAKVLLLRATGGCLNQRGLVRSAF